MGSRKSTWSTATVTTSRRAWRMATEAPASSISFMMCPPWTLPCRLASPGPINCERVTRDSATRRGAGSTAGGGLVNVLDRIHVHRVEAVGGFFKDVNGVVFQVAHQGRQGHRERQAHARLAGRRV